MATALGSTKVSLENRTARNLQLRSVDLTWGIWTRRPTQRIEANTTEVWESESNWGQPGTKGSVEYGNDSCFVKLFWDNTRIGSNRYNAFTSSGLHVTCSGGSGDNAHFFFQLVDDPVTLGKDDSHLPAALDDQLATGAQPHPAQAGILKKLSEYIQSKRTQKRTLTFLLVGRTGAGKSSTINSLFGKEVAKPSDFKPGTLSVRPYPFSHGGTSYNIVDTPGLCDAPPDAGNDKKYLDLMTSQIREVDSLWYVLNLAIRRVDASEQRAIQLISEAFGPKAWAQAIIVFTHADTVPEVKYQETLNGFTRLVRAEIAKYAHWQADEVPVVAISNDKPTTPDGNRWLEELFTVVATRFSEAGMVPFLLSMKEDLLPTTTSQPEEEPPKPPRINPSPIQMVRIADRVAQWAQIGGRIGKPLGWFGETVGTALGGAAGAFVSWLFD